MFGPASLFAIVLVAAGTAAASLTPMFVGIRETDRAQLIEVTIGTTVFCTSTALIFYHYGTVAGACALIVAWLVNRSFALIERLPVDRICAWASAGALLLYISRL
jgi:hypothetical protein